jgi:hypothetical protein
LAAFRKKRLANNAMMIGAREENVDSNYAASFSFWNYEKRETRKA